MAGSQAVTWWCAKPSATRPGSTASKLSCQAGTTTSSSLRRPPVAATYSGAPSPVRSAKAPEPSAPKNGASAEPALAGTLGNPPPGKSWASTRCAPSVLPR